MTNLHDCPRCGGVNLPRDHQNNGSCRIQASFNLMHRRGHRRIMERDLIEQAEAILALQRQTPTSDEMRLLVQLAVGAGWVLPRPWLGEIGKAYRDEVDRQRDGSEGL